MLRNVRTRWHDMDLALWYTIMSRDVCCSPFAHYHDFNASRITLSLHRQRLTHGGFVDVRSFESCVISEIFFKSSVDIKIRLDPEVPVILKKTRAEELKVVNDE